MKSFFTEHEILAVFLQNVGTFLLVLGKATLVSAIISI